MLPVVVREGVRPHIAAMDRSSDIAPQSRSERLRVARLKVAALKGLYIHATVYVVVVIGLIIVDLATGAPYWVHWVALGWGIGVAAHAAGVHAGVSNSIAQWERRKVAEFLEESEPR